MIGQTISHYKILEKLGEGGMGVVYKAEDLKLHRLVALKFLPPFASDADKQRFVQEARAISTLNHPHIATIHDIEEADGRLFIVFEYLPGGSLKSAIKKLHSEGKALPLQQALDYGLQIVEGLRHAHSHGIIHRDVKLDNILLSAEAEVKISDFGLAKLAGEVGLTKTDSVVGTTAYMSPEQLLGGEVDHRTDIFSFGIVLFEMMTGARPFRGEHEAALMYSIVHEEPRPMKDFRKDIPPELEGVVHRALAKSPEDRYPNVDELMEEIRLLKEVSEGKRMVGFRPSFFGKGVRFSLPMKITASVVFLLVAVFLVLFRRSEKPPEALATPRKSIVVLPFENYTGEKSFDRYRVALATMLITDLTQLKSVRVVSETRLYEILRDLKVLDEQHYSSETLEKIRKYADVDHFIVGSLNKAGARIRLDFQVQDASTAEIIGGDRIEGNTEEAIFSMVDAMSSRVPKVLGVSEVTEAATAKGIAEITSGSLEANLLYEEGVSNFYKGNYLKAIEFLKEALDRDSTFALALSRLAETYSALGYDLRAVEYADRALRHADRLTISQRYSIEANHAKTHYDFDGAVEIYKKLAAISPQDSHVYFDLGMVFERLEMVDSAIVSFQKVVTLEKNNAAAYVELGKLFESKGDPKLASESVEAALKIYSLVKSQEGRASALIALGDVIRKRDPNKAREAYEEALQIHRELGNKPGIASALKGIGSIYLSQFKGAEARSYFEQAIPVLREIGDKKSTASLLNNVANSHLLEGKTAEALELRRSGLKIAREIHNKQLLAEIEYGIGLDLQRLGQNEKALPYIEEAHEYFKQIGDRRKERISALAIGDERRKQLKIDEALRIFHESVVAGRLLGDRKLISWSCERIAPIYELQARYDQAISFFQEGLTNYEAIGDKSGTADALSALGFNFFSVGKIDTAAHLLKNALAIAQELGSKDQIGRVQSRLGAMWQLQGQKDSALAYFNRSLKLFREANTTEEETDTKSRLATLYVSMSRIKEGVALAREAAQQAAKTKSEESIATASTRLALCYLAAQQYREAVKEAQSAISISRQLGMRENLWRSYAVLAKGFRAQRKEAEASENLRLMNQTLDEIERDLSKQFQASFRKRADITKAVAEMVTLP